MSEYGLLSANAAQIVVWAAASGVLSMLVYKFTSPQQRLKELGDEAAAARVALAQYDGAFQEAWPLVRHSLSVAWDRLKVALLPSLLAGLPVLLAVFCLEPRLSNAAWLPAAPSWVQSGWFVFCPITTVAAVLAKVALKIR